MKEFLSRYLTSQKKGLEEWYLQWVFVQENKNIDKSANSFSFIFKMWFIVLKYMLLTTVPVEIFSRITAEKGSKIGW